MHIVPSNSPPFCAVYGRDSDHQAQHIAERNFFCATVGSPSYEEVGCPMWADRASVRCSLLILRFSAAGCAGSVLGDGVFRAGGIGRRFVRCRFGLQCVIFAHFPIGVSAPPTCLAIGRRIGGKWNIQGDSQFMSIRDEGEIQFLIFFPPFRVLIGFLCCYHNSATTTRCGHGLVFDRLPQPGGRGWIHDARLYGPRP